MKPFTYPDQPHVRRHGPVGYASYESFRPWLRDEFYFRCVYCLAREQFLRLLGGWDLDHFLPKSIYPERGTDYDNILYSCRRCNLAKGDDLVPDPLTVMLSAAVIINEDGSIQGITPDARRLIAKLGLNSSEDCEFRRLWIDVVALAEASRPRLLDQIIGFPEDLPDLSRLEPPRGNVHPNGIHESCFARRMRGELPSQY